MPRRKRRQNARRRARRAPRLSGLKKALLYMLLAGGLVTPLYIYYLDIIVRKQFEGKRWALPARVYARPLELFSGKALTPEQFEAELRLLGYRYSVKKTPGHYIRHNNRFEVVTRAFKFWDGTEMSTFLTARFNRQGIAQLQYGDTKKALSLVRLDPVMIGSIYPSHKEDRILVKLAEIPDVLLAALLAVEDKNYYSHFGVDPRGVLRALWANVKARGLVQGGSTLTQQLVKNFFLTSERTLWRKMNEAIMALLLEYHYDKKSILQAYSNEIYLGQDGERAIHGFGLASWFYFQRPINELQVAEAALLVGMVRGPSLYDPRRNAKRAKDRRNLVVDLLARQGVVDAAEADIAKATDLNIASKRSGSITHFPAFIELVRRQLRRDYREDDLNSEGLQIFTTLDPIVQSHAEKALANTLTRLEADYRLREQSLEAAVVLSSVDGGEVLAMVGGRKPRYAGFNRALHARRPVGSLIKPAVYLTALEQPEQFTLSSLIDDGPLEWKMSGGQVWTPFNYDKQFHGLVTLQKGLVKSYNVATARLGLRVGVDKVRETVQRLGVAQQLNPYPSVLLGATLLSPFDVTQMYQTLASGGFQTPLRAIREVLTNQGNLLQHYELALERKFEPGPIYLINRALQETVASGTARNLARTLSADYRLAGKTGTTDELRDSWFAGYSGNYVAAVWVGRDDNKSAGLTGAGGAMRVWANVFAGLNIQALDLTMPNNVEERRVDQRTDRLADTGCSQSILLPYIKGSAPKAIANCSGGGLRDWMRRVIK